VLWEIKKSQPNPYYPSVLKTFLEKEFVALTKSYSLLIILEIIMAFHDHHRKQMLNKNYK